MGSPENLISKLGPKTTHFNTPSASSFGGLSQSDIAGGFGAMKNKLASLLLGVWHGVWKKDLGELVDKMQIQLKKKEFKKKKNVYRVNMIILIAVTEYTAGHDFKRCSVCKGRGSIHKPDWHGDCTHCSGSGKKPLSEQQRAHNCDIPWSTFQESYSETYETVIKYCQNLKRNGMVEFERIVRH